VASVVFSVTTPGQAGVVSLVSLVVVIVVMEGVRKLARSGSVKVEEFFSTNKSRQNVEEVVVEDTDTDTPTTLPILRSFNTKGKVGDSKKEKEKSEGSKGAGAVTPSYGLIQYEDLLQHLTCSACSCVVCPPVLQCRKGHLYCRACRTGNCCKICKQTFVDAPNLALEKIMTLIAFPCRYGPQGCPDSIFLPSRLQHETLCQYRPVPCQYNHHGCTQVFSVKDMFWHHKMCKYAHYPHENILPNMPARNKNKDKAGGESEKQNGLPTTISTSNNSSSTSTSSPTINPTTIPASSTANIDVSSPVS